MDLVFQLPGKGDKMISLKFQKIILFIPFLNAAILLFFVYNTMKANWIGKKFILGLGISFLAAFSPTVLYRILLLLPLNTIWQNILNFAYVYMLCLSTGNSLICYQRRLGVYNG